MDRISSLQEANTGLEYADVGFNTCYNDALKAFSFQAFIKGLHITAIEMHFGDRFIGGQEILYPL
jgi:hypothetical protein